MPAPSPDRIKIRKDDNFYSNRVPNGNKDYQNFDHRTFGHASNFQSSERFPVEQGSHINTFLDKFK